jgi:hypothetical protein
MGFRTNRKAAKHFGAIRQFLSLTTASFGAITAEGHQNGADFYVEGSLDRV